MKVIYLIILFFLISSFYGLFCNEKNIDNFNNEISSNTSINFVSNFNEKN